MSDLSTLHHVAMRPGIELRTDYDAARLRALAKATRNAGQSRRLAGAGGDLRGGSRTKAARIGGVGLQTVRDWVVRFNAHGPEGLIDGKAPGQPSMLNATIARPCWPSSRAAPFRRCTAWCAGGWSI